MADERDDGFYVGYAPRAPRSVASRTRAAVFAMFAVAAGLAALLVCAQHAFAPSVFEFGVVRELRGVIRERPYPALLVARPGAGPGAVSRFALTVFGKHGADAAVAGLDGVEVRLPGSLIYRDGRTMIQIEGPVERVGDPSALPSEAESELGEMTLVGEIVDSKCFLGLMKPGHTKPHRSCATRCIAGGVPPVLLIRDDSGRAEYLLLVDESGGPVNDRVLDLVAEPVEIRGRVSRLGEQLLLRADPASYRRLPRSGDR